MRPKESLSANTSLFFGVYRETEAEKSKSGYNLKVAHIVLLPRKQTTLIRAHIRSRYVETHTHRLPAGPGKLRTFMTAGLHKHHRRLSAVPLSVHKTIKSCVSQHCYPYMAKSIKSRISVSEALSLGIIFAKKTKIITSQAQKTEQT